MQHAAKPSCNTGYQFGRAAKPPRNLAALCSRRAAERKESAMPRFTGSSADGLWASLSHAWLQVRTDRPADPRLVEDAPISPAAAPRIASPQVGAWLR
jgi:hypothetical protein